MKSFRLVAAIVMSAFGTASLGTAAADFTTLCPGSAFVTVCITKTDPILVVHPYEIGGSQPIGELQEWARDLSSGASLHLTCFSGSLDTCNELASLDFVFVRTLLAVSAPDVDPLLCPGIGVYEATVTVKVLGTGVENVPVVTGGTDLC